ncbi:MAG: hypothetical protein KDC10_17275, partial [Calditrichaeota bacterium]|nr:hypothetical protein [Calditrichota bacterium]
AAWVPTSFNHTTMTDWPMTGAHQGMACISCHAGGVYTGTPAECWGCHQTDYQEADDPDHAGGSYPQDCTLCHSNLSWEGADFNHDLTSFPLVGQHASVACASCHTSGYAGTPSACEACHMPDWNGAELIHEESSFQLDCARCHTPAAWVPTSFNHTTMTDWPMTGAHQGM